MRMSRSIRFAAAAALATPLAAGAQAVRGAIIDETTRQPVIGAVVGLVDGGGQEIVTTLSSETGRFVLRAPAAGAYALRTRRIGLRSVTSAPIQLATGEWRDYTFVVAADPIPLAAVLVTARSKRCDVRPAEGMAAAILFDEARKALDAAAITQRERRVAMARRNYIRALDPRSGRVLSEKVRDDVVTSDRPFASIPAETLAARGYSRQVGDSVDYYGPDADVLLSDAFADGHCFRVESKEEAGGELAGLAFEPVRRPGDRRVDIEGTLWLDAKSGELRYVEYRYTGLPKGTPRDKMGGRIDFRRLPGGGWIVERWALRTAAIAVIQKGYVLGRTIDEEREYVVVALRETGGVVSGQVLDARPVAVTGTVFDSTRNAPLVGAQVFLSGTAHVTRTDSSGRFALDDLLPGAYALSFLHPRLDSLGWVDPGRELTLARGEPREVALVVPTSAAPAVVAAAPELAAPGAPPPAAGAQTLPARRVVALRDGRGFEARRREGRGHFIDATMIDKRGAVRLSDVLRTAPGVRVISVGGAVQNFRITMSRSSASTTSISVPGGPLPELTNPGAGGGAGGGGAGGGGAGGGGNVGGGADSRRGQRGLDDAASLHPCAVDLWLDGARFELASGDIDNLVDPSEIAGIEIYNSALAPPEYRTGSSSCGVILIWTKR
jgi:hypothetical protein